MGGILGEYLLLLCDEGRSFLTRTRLLEQV